MAVAPLLGLTIALELRQTNWQRYRRGARIATMMFLCLILVGLAIAAANAIHVLHEWNPEVPPDSTEAFVSQIVVQVAVLGVLVPPVSSTFFIFFGVGAGTIRRIQRNHAKGAESAKRHIAALKHQRHLLMQEVAELVFANPASVFQASDSGMRVVITNPRIYQLRNEAQFLQRRIDDDVRQWRKLDKKFRKLLKRADKQIGMTARGKLVRRVQSFN